MTNHPHLWLRHARERHAADLRAADRRREARASLTDRVPASPAAPARRTLARALRAWARRLDPDRPVVPLTMRSDI